MLPLFIGRVVAGKRADRLTRTSTALPRAAELRAGHDFAARDFEPWQIERGPHSRFAFFHFAIVRLNGTNPRRCAGWLNNDHVAALRAAAGQSAGHDRSDAAQDESPVDRESRFADINLRWNRARMSRRVAPLIARCHRRFWSRRERSVPSRKQFQQVARASFPQARSRGQRLRDRDNRARHAEVFENLEMLFRLRHPAVIRRDDKQREIDRAYARDHVLHEIFVTGHIDDA